MHTPSHVTYYCDRQSVSMRVSASYVRSSLMDEMLLLETRLLSYYTWICHTTSHVTYDWDRQSVSMHVSASCIYASLMNQLFLQETRVMLYLHMNTSRNESCHIWLRQAVSVYACLCVICTFISHGWVILGVISYYTWMSREHVKLRVKSHMTGTVSVCACLCVMHMFRSCSVAQSFHT